MAKKVKRQPTLQCLRKGTALKWRAGGTVGNYPVLAADPASLVNGDIWIKNTGGVRTLNARIGGVTYATILT